MSAFLPFFFLPIFLSLFIFMRLRAASGFAAKRGLPPPHASRCHAIKFVIGNIGKTVGFPSPSSGKWLETLVGGLDLSLSSLWYFFFHFQFPLLLFSSDRRAECAAKMEIYLAEECARELPSSIGEK